MEGGKKSWNELEFSSQDFLFERGDWITHRSVGWASVIYSLESGLRPLCEVCSCEYNVFWFFPLQICFTLFVLQLEELALDQSKACPQAERHDRKLA